MSREVRIISKDFKPTLNKVWWGYRLPPIPCQQCSDTVTDIITHKSINCPICEGTREVYPHVTLEWFEISSNLGKSVLAGKLDSYGFQMWETVTEGSPISPVCDTPQILADWLADNKASPFGSDTANAGTWLRMIMKGYAPTMIISSSGGLQSGVEFIAERNEETQ